ncbi:response regulator [Candidatus Saccharibacteria bacterium]|nr:response regulator [Candidatus Saccharibacteria bacterium]
MHVLLLEPDNLLAASLNNYLAREGHSVAWHSHPQDAVTSADRQTPQAVITELQLAGRSGVEFLYEFRSYPEWQAIPIIVLSNLRPEETIAYQEVFQELNIAGYFYKPRTNLSQLLETLETSSQPART